MFDRLEVFEKKYEECNQKLYDPAVVSDPEAYAALMKEVKGAGACSSKNTKSMKN